MNKSQLLHNLMSEELKREPAQRARQRALARLSLETEQESIHPGPLSAKFARQDRMFPKHWAVAPAHCRGWYVLKRIGGFNCDQ